MTTLLGNVLCTVSYECPHFIVYCVPDSENIICSTSALNRPSKICSSIRQIAP